MMRRMHDMKKRKKIYEFMVKAACKFSDDPDIFEMVYSWGGYNMKFVADRTNYGIYSIYGCDEDEIIHLEQPLYTGNVEEIVGYLNDKNNVENVMQQVYESNVLEDV